MWESRLIKTIVKLSILTAQAHYKKIPWYKRWFTRKPDIDVVTHKAEERAQLIIKFYKNKK